VSIHLLDEKEKCKKTVQTPKNLMYERNRSFMEKEEEEERRNISRLCFSLPPFIPKSIAQSLHLTTLSKEDFGRVSRTFIHNGVVVSCIDHIRVSLPSSYQINNDAWQCDGDGKRSRW
jgi:hypothetical protein